MTMVGYSAPMNEATEYQKEILYSQLTTFLKDVPRHDILCVIGDFNLKVANGGDYCVEVLGNHGLGERNENGKSLIKMAQSFGLVVGGTLFIHKEIHKYSETSPDGHIKKRPTTFLLARSGRRHCDLSALRDADIFSDYSMTGVKIRVKLSDTRQMRTTRKQPCDCKKKQVTNKYGYSLCQK